jgi:hypothetical protein
MKKAPCSNGRRFVRHWGSGRQSRSPIVRRRDQDAARAARVSTLPAYSPDNGLRKPERGGKARNRHPFAQDSGNDPVTLLPHVRTRHARGSQGIIATQAGAPVGQRIGWQFAQWCSHVPPLPP